MSTPTIFEECARLGVATVYEAAGRVGLVDVALHQLVAGSRAAGPARTVRCAQDDNLMVHASIELIRPGEIVVLTMPEPRAVALIGELLVTQIVQAGAAGVLVDASVRDAEELATMGLPIWARWIRVRGAQKITAGELDVPVTVGGATIAPGDMVVLDTDGACTVPKTRLESVVSAARDRFDAEALNRERYRRGELSYDVNDLRRVVATANPTTSR